MRICEGWVGIFKEIYEGWCIKCNNPLIRVKKHGQTSMTSQGTQKTC